METRLEMLRMGADDYILKPFDLNEVLVRMEVVLRRGRTKAGGTAQGRLEILNLTFDTVNGCAAVKGIPLKLTAKESAILQLFLEHPHKTFSKANLYETIWQEPYFYEDNMLNVHMSNLRNKLKKADSENEYIETVWGIGCRAGRMAGENRRNEVCDGNGYFAGVPALRGSAGILDFDEKADKKHDGRIKKKPSDVLQQAAQSTIV